MNLIEFTPNVPQELCMGRDTSPVVLSQGAGCLYTLADGRILHVSGSVSQNMAKYNLQPGETFMLCLHQKETGLPFMICWLSPDTEKARAAAEQSELERQLAASIEEAETRKRPQIRTMAPKRPELVTESPLAPTGTEGAPIPLPSVQRKPAIAAVAGNRRERPGPIPLNVAFREIVQFVCAELNASGEQWSENSRQDMISTVIISAQKLNLLGGWERGEAA